MASKKGKSGSFDFADHDRAVIHFAQDDTSCRGAEDETSSGYVGKWVMVWVEWRDWAIRRRKRSGVGAHLKLRSVKTESAGQGGARSARIVDAGDEAAELRPPGAGLQAPGGAGNEKYQRILDAAVEVIAEKGYFGAPISAIAARAGVADGTVYLYFKSKDEVLRTSIDQYVDRFHRQVLERFKVLDDPREQLEYIAQVHLESSSVNRAMAIVMQTEVRQSAQFIAEFSRHHLVKYIQLVREVVRRGQQQGIFRRDISDGVVAHCMFGAIDELLSSAVFTGRTYDAKATAKQVLDVLLNGISE